MPKDLFSNHAKEYATYRPAYPQELYDFIFKQVSHFDQAWDCGTGSGQVAKALSSKFKTVHATDISPKQIQNAIQKDNIVYKIAAAESSFFAANTFDLITVGQAVHWFELEKFYDECKRVAKPDSILAIFGYSPVRFNDGFDKILDDFYYKTIYSYWEMERRIVEDKYASLSFPFENILSNNFKIRLSWTLKEVEGYLNTWSAVQAYKKETKSNPVVDLIRQIEPLWTSERLSVYFPVFLRMGTINK